MTVAITGASGFIGSHVLKALAARGEDVISLGRTAPKVELPGVRHVTMDLATVTEADCRSIGSPDVLIHLAWGGLPNYLSLHHFETELLAQYRFLRAMVGAGLPAMVVAGTCYEYGMVNGPLDEECQPAPANPYAYAKVALWRQLEYLKAVTPFDLTWARLFYTWGEGQARTSLYPLLRAAADRGDAIFQMSAGEQLRDYLPVAEVAAILADLTALRADAGVVNVSSGAPTSIRSLVERWIGEHGWAIRPEFGQRPYPTYEPLAFWGSAEKRRALLQGG
jgi:dTDP-6-deoxy-L-talose 4-dehydrogenase (NAD+)